MAKHALIHGAINRQQRLLGTFLQGHFKRELEFSSFTSFSNFFVKKWGNRNVGYIV